MYEEILFERFIDGVLVVGGVVDEVVGEEEEVVIRIVEKIVVMIVED